MTLVIAHRGASADRAEQTRSAYQYAFDMGADGVECDVRLTSDRHVVCLHDPTVDRTSDGHGAVHELTLDQLRDMDFGAEGDGQQPGALITLDEIVVLAVSAGRPVVLAIELKHPNPFDLELEARVLDVLDAVGWDRVASSVGDVTISLMSFNPASVAALAPAVNPRHLMMLTADIELGDLADDLRAMGGGADGAEEQLRHALTVARGMIDDGSVGGAGPELGFLVEHPDHIRGWVEAGRTVRVWTVDTADGIDACVRVGAQEITTNRPDFVRKYLDRAHGG